jgi:hypothetical protein
MIFRPFSSTFAILLEVYTVLKTRISAIDIKVKVKVPIYVHTRREEVLLNSFLISALGEV